MSGIVPKIIVVAEQPVFDVLAYSGIPWDPQHPVHSISQMWDDLSAARLDQGSKALIFSDQVGPAADIATAVAVMAPHAPVVVICQDTESGSRIHAAIARAQVEHQQAPAPYLLIELPTNGRALLEQLRPALSGIVTWPTTYPEIVDRPFTQPQDVVWTPNVAPPQPSPAIDNQWTQQPTQANPVIAAPPQPTEAAPVASAAPAAMPPQQPPVTYPAPAAPTSPQPAAAPPAATTPPVVAPAAPVPPNPETQAPPAAPAAPTPPTPHPGAPVQQPPMQQPPAPSAPAQQTPSVPPPPAAPAPAVAPAPTQPVTDATDLLSQPPLPGQLTLTVTSAKGGSGKTTVAACIAATIAKSSAKAGHPKRVVLVDMDTRDSQVGSLIGRWMPTALNIRVQPVWDKDAILSHLVHSEELGIDVLLAPVRPRSADNVGPDFYRHVIRSLQRTHDVVVMDTSVNYLDPLISTVCLPEASAILVVTTLAATSVHGMARALREILEPVENGGMGIPRQRVGIVVNQAVAGVGMDVDQVLQAALRVPVVGAVPLATTDVLTATNSGLVHTLLSHPLLGPAYFKLAQACLPGVPLTPLVDPTQAAQSMGVNADGLVNVDQMDNRKKGGLFRK